MSEKNRQEFILETIKVFIWPTLIVVAVLWLGTDLKEILKSRTWKVGIIEVGDRVSNLGNTLQDELLLQKDYLDKIRENRADVNKVEEYVGKAIESIENAQKGIKKEVQTIQEAIPQGLNPELGKASPIVEQKGTTVQNPNTANGWETLGFDYILDKEVNKAIEAFSHAEKIWPDYHNVSEIRKLLIQNRGELEQAASPKWKEIYQKVTTRFSWGMPSDVRNKMQKHITGQ
jgi:tetratricopeptide (TPR) repeat protein